MKIPGQLACLLACRVVVGIGCSLPKPPGPPEEEWSHWINWADPMLHEALLPSIAPATQAADHHAFRADQSLHPTDLLTSLPDPQLPQADSGSQSTDAGGNVGAKPWESLEAIHEDSPIIQPHHERTSPSEHDSCPTSPALVASQHSASPSIITDTTTTTTTTTSQTERKSPARSEAPIGAPIQNKTGRSQGSLAALPATQLSADPKLDLSPVRSHIQSDHSQPHLDSTSEPPSSHGRPRKRKERPQRTLDQPAHPVMGSVHGKEILPPEPPETLPPQALMLFDSPLFQLAATADVPPDERYLQQMQIDAIRQVMEACPSTSILVIPEDKFLELSKRYNSYLHKQTCFANRQEGSTTSNPTGKEGTSMTRELHRKFKLAGKVKEFHAHLDFWYSRWFANTGTQFKINANLAHYKFLSPERRLTIHSLYLFYVEMISSIVPRTSTQSVSLASELTSAQEAFERLSKAANQRATRRENKQPFNNADAVEGAVDEGANKLLDKAAEKLEDKEASWASYKTFPSLWTYLEFWMDTNRPGIFKEPSQSHRELTVSSKAFFNTVFFHSYTALYKRSRRYQLHATPGFMSKKKKKVY